MTRSRSTQPGDVPKADQHFYLVMLLVALPFIGIGITLTFRRLRDAGLSPWLVGRLRDSTGSYSAGFLVLIGMGLLGAASAAMLPKGKKPA